MNIFILPTDTCFWIWCPIYEIDSYNKIYEIKNRELNKPIAILIDSLEYLKNNTLLNKQQIDYLVNYKNSFTILIDKNKIKNKDILEQIKKVPNSNLYKKVAFRIAHNFMHRKLINKYWALFLSSANKSWECELFWSADVRDIFKKEIEKYWIKVFAHPWFCIDSSQKSSDIFEFIWDSLEIKYLRKN